MFLTRVLANNHFLSPLFKIFVTFLIPREAPAIVDCNTFNKLGSSANKPETSSNDSNSILPGQRF